MVFLLPKLLFIVSLSLWSCPSYCLSQYLDWVSSNCIPRWLDVLIMSMGMGKFEEYVGVVGLYLNLATNFI